MNDQTDAGNLAKTNNTENAGGAPAAQADPAAKPQATLDNAAGTTKPPASADAAKAAGSTSRANLNDVKINPITGRPFGEARPLAANSSGKVNPATQTRPASDPGPQSQAGSAHINPGLSTDAGKIAQHEQVDRENAKRNEANEAGHQKNMDAIERAHAEGAERQEKAHAPPTGKQRDENTPRIDPVTGAKTWTL